MTKSNVSIIILIGYIMGYDSFDFDIYFPQIKTYHSLHLEREINNNLYQNKMRNTAGRGTSHNPIYLDYITKVRHVKQSVYSYKFAQKNTSKFNKIHKHSPKYVLQK